MKYILIKTTLIMFFLGNLPLAAGEIKNYYDFSSTGPFLNQSSTGIRNWYSGDVKHTSVRRKILRYHPIAGLTTWGFWLATNLKGEQLLKRFKPQTDNAATALYLSNPSQNLPLYMAFKLDNPAALALSSDPAFIQNNLPLYYLIRNNSKWEAEGAGMHRRLATATTGMYILTASLAMLAPSKLKSTASEGVDSIFLHKGLALVHLASMLALSRLGTKIEQEGPAAARKMQTAGWTGFTALTLAIGVVYF